MNNEQAKIENWVTTHLKTNFFYYVLLFIFLIVFSLIFSFNIESHSLLYLFAVSFFPALMVSLLTYVLLREYFFLFFILLIFITPIFVVVVIVFILTNDAPVSGYMLYTNNLTDKCNVRILDYNKGVPWYTSKGCVLNVLGEKEKDKNKRVEAIKQYIKVGGSGKRWSNTCLDLKISKSQFNKNYEEILIKNSNFSLRNDYSITSDEYKFIKKISIFRNTTMNTLSDFKKDVPDIKIGDLFNLCEIEPIVLGDTDVFKISK